MNGTTLSFRFFVVVFVFLLMLIPAISTVAQRVGDPVTGLVENVGVLAGRLLPAAISELDSRSPTERRSVQVGSITYEGYEPQLAHLLRSIMEEELLVAAESLRGRAHVEVMSDLMGESVTPFADSGNRLTPPDLLVRVRAGSGASTVLFSVQILDSTGRILVAGRVSAESTPEMEAVLAPRETASMDYLSFGGSGSGAGDDVPDNYQTARSVDIDSHQSGLSLDGGDEDWFTFLVPDGDGLRAATDQTDDIVAVKIYTRGPTDTYIEVFGPDDPLTRVAENDDAEDMNASVTLPLSPAGRFWIKVRGFSGGTTGTYDLYLEPTFVSLDSWEPNNTRHDAAVVGLGDLPIAAGLRPSGDRDWYYLSGDVLRELLAPVSDNGGQAAMNDKAVVAYTTGTLDTVMTVYDDHGSEIANNDDGGDGANARVIVPNHVTNFYIEVGGFGGGQEGDYSLHIESAQIQYDEFEPDDSAEDAGLLEWNTPPQRRIFSAESDTDWVRIVVPSEGNTRRRISVETYGEIDTYMTLYDESLQPLATSDDDGYGMNARVEELLQPGEYFIEVTPLYLHEAGAEYALEGRLY